MWMMEYLQVQPNVESSEIVIMENNESTSESCLANIIRHKYVSIIFKVKFKKEKVKYVLNWLTVS